MKRTVQKTKYFVLGALLATMGLWGLAVTLPHAFNSGDEIKSAEMNANFQALKNAVDALEAKLSKVSASQKAPPTKVGALAYVLVKANGTKWSGYEFNPSGTITTTRTSQGKYKVHFNGLALGGGIVLVSTYLGTGTNASFQDNVCHVRSFGGSTVNVECFDMDSANGQDIGMPQDASFSVLVIR